jgi:hypothetical protein
LSDISRFVSEQQNPGNAKRIAAIRVELPSLAEFEGLVFVDTPGWESALEHNTESSLNWLPNAGLALVAVSGDPPLSQRDIVSTGISRLSSQWEESINAALPAIAIEAPRRLDGLLATVDRLIENAGGDRAPTIRDRLDQIADARKTWKLGDDRRQDLLYPGGAAAELA